ncbi:hypothetical protein [Nostoc sp.]|uniref:hypothetical protein n=1 Tax=Nostoc sp. TaxID=1180 RepID=UPI002FF51F7C
MFGNWSWRKVLKTFGSLAVGIASISMNNLTSRHVALATPNSSQLQNTNQLTISESKTRSSNILVVQNPVPQNPAPPITRIINGEIVKAVAFYDYYNPSTSNHFYTTNFGELGNGSGYILKGIAAYIPKQQYSGTVPLYRYYSLAASDYLYTTNLSARDRYVYQTIAGYVYAPPAIANTTPPGPPGPPGTIALYYNSTASKHLYTTNFRELGSGKNVDIAGYVIPTGDNSTTS